MRWKPVPSTLGRIVARAAVLTLALLAGGCRDDRGAEGGTRPVVDNSAGPPMPGTAKAAPKWSLQPGNATLQLATGGTIVLRLSCKPPGGQLALEVPAFRVIGSEERLSLGSGDTVLALVADTNGDRNGVTGTGAVPEDLGLLLSGRVSASYGAQTSGPHPAPAAVQVRAFVRSCAPGVPPETAPDEPAEVAGARISPCLVQDGKRLAANALRAVGTEPFWAARIEGRCVTYSHPDDQAGTRVWTRFSATGEGASWSGALKGKPFALRSRPTECSDGMSDRRYPLEVTLTVGGEERRGCAAPL